MRQIYYTQCPMGYGRGASNGFQIKRMSEVYPLSGDFRHLGMKAFLPTCRTLAPKVLRYRLDGDSVELARLSPRQFEYATERGDWGRPGGVFAHGLQMTASEAKRFTSFPAGLINAPFWVDEDRTPSMGEEPKPFDWNELKPTRPAITPRLLFQLPRLLTAVAKVASEGRTLFLIDERRPEQLTQEIALLTFAFPLRFRRKLTFSTYHERPEDLPGYRISGTTVSARPNRPTLLSQGVIAELESGVVEPALEVSSWAETLSEWLIRWDESDQAAWGRTAQRANAVAKLDWSVDGLNALFDLERSGSTCPVDAPGWNQLASTLRWAAQAGLGHECVSARDANWWRSAADSSKTSAEGREAFLTYVGLDASWANSEQAMILGSALAAWFEDCNSPERNSAIVTVTRGAPEAIRTVFVASAIASMKTNQADSALICLKTESSFDPASLLPLQVRGVFTALVQTGRKDEMKTLLVEAFARRGVLPLVLDAVEALVNLDPASWSSFAPFVPSLIDQALKRKQFEVEQWALRQRDPARWLSPSLRRIFAEPDNQEAWKNLCERTPPELLPTLCHVVLQVTVDPNLPGQGQGFRWAIENLLLPLEKQKRPHERMWASVYLITSQSDYGLLKKLDEVGKRGEGTPLANWIDDARLHGELDPAQIARIDNLGTIGRLDKSAQFDKWMKIDLARIREWDRGAFLKDWLQMHWGEDLNRVLERIGTQWRDSLRNRPGLGSLQVADRPEQRSLARAICSALNQLSSDPKRWIATLDHWLTCMGIDETERWHPTGLASAIIADTLLTMNFAEKQRLASELLNMDRSWHALYLHAKDDLAPHPLLQALQGFQRWQKDYGKWNKPSRFAEIYLNACDGPRLAAIIAVFAEELGTLETLPWWDHVSHPGANDDIREAFARLAPMAPLDAIDDRFPITLRSVHVWMRKRSNQSAGNIRNDEGAINPDEDAPQSGVGPMAAESVNLSKLGIARWQCIQELTRFHQDSDGLVRRQIVADWRSKMLPFAQLDDLDRYRFLAWVIRGAVGDTIMVEPFASWIVKSLGCGDTQKLRGWANEIGDLVQVRPDEIRARSPLVDDLVREVERVLQGE